MKKAKKNINFLDKKQEKRCQETAHRWYTLKLMFVETLPSGIDKMSEDERVELIKNIPDVRVCINCGLHELEDKCLKPELVKTVRDSFVKDFISKAKEKSFKRHLKELVEATIYTSKDKYPHITEHQLRELLQKSFAIQVEAELKTEADLQSVHTQALLESFRVGEKL